jgi:hypothetical protein
MTSKFGSVTVGIHGQELPKFQHDDTVKEWWKQKPNYNEEPTYQSAVELKENNKFWAKNDEIKFQDVRADYITSDVFKVHEEKRAFKDVVADKVTTMNHWKAVEEPKSVEFGKGYKKKLQWTEQERIFKTKKDERLFDKLER